MTRRMNAARYALLAGFLLACAPAEQNGDPRGNESTESTESDLTARGRGVLATDLVSYALNEPNVARELEASGVKNIPGTLSFSQSTSPYAYAATVELSAWSSVSTSGWNGEGLNTLVLRVEGSPTSRTGKVAKAIFDAMTNAAETTENGATVRRSPKGLVTCANYTDHVQCMLAGFGHVGAN